MKKILGILAVIIFLAGCSKENILWLEPGYEYEIATIMIRDSTGAWDQVYFWDETGTSGERLTFTKFHPLGVSGNGEVKYSYNTGGYYGSRTDIYSFGWSKESQKAISLKFSHYDPIIMGQNPNTISFFETLNGDYIVSKESIKRGKVKAQTIVLRSTNNRCEIVLVR